jgi:hypothetical protein
MLVRRIEALGYGVVILPWDIEWVDIPQEYWGVAILIADSRQLFFIVPIPRRRCQLTRSGIFLCSYKDP